MPLDPPRRRLPYALLAAATIPLGLLSRAIPALPGWLSKSAGDALYAALCFFLGGLLCVSWSTARVSLGAWIFCALIETSQLFHPPWLDAIRSTRMGGLVLGHGFHAMDLLYYGIGAGLAAGLEKAARERA